MTLHEALVQHIFLNLKAIVACVYDSANAHIIWGMTYHGEVPFAFLQCYHLRMRSDVLS